MNYHHHPTTIIRAIALITPLLIAGPARAQVAEILVIPTGKGEAFDPTVRMAKAITDVFNKGAKAPVAQLFYPFPPQAAPSKKELREVKRLHGLVKRAFGQMSYAKVDKLAGKLRDLEKDLLKKGRRAKGYVKTLHFLAATAHFAGRVKKAFKFMNDAVLFDNSPPKKEIFNPDILRLHQRVLAERSAVGKLTLTSKPSGLIWFNNVLAGLAEGTLQKPAGLYMVKYYRPGHMPRMRWIRIKPNRKRKLDTVLNLDASPEMEVVGQLRVEAAAKEPGAVVQKLTLEQAAIHVAVVGAKEGCNATRCTINVSWAEEDTWRQKKSALLKGDLHELALKLIPKVKLRTDLLDEGDEDKPKKPKKPKKPMNPLLVSACITSSQCAAHHRCENGRCIKFTSVTRKWWFWTIVGAVAVGAVVGIAVPLGMPDNPVIEVQ